MATTCHIPITPLPDTRGAAEGSIRDSSEVVLPYLMSDIYIGSAESRPGGSDTPRASIIDTSTIMILEIIIRSERFSKATRVWCTSVYEACKTSGIATATPQLKAWWEHNKAAVLAKQYDKATWLPAEKTESNAPLGGAAASPGTPKSLAPGQPTGTLHCELWSSVHWFLAAVFILAGIGFGLRFLRRK